MCSRISVWNFLAGRAHDPNSFSYSDGSAKMVKGILKGNGPEQGRQDHEAAGTFTGTGLMMAHSQEVLRIDPRGKIAPQIESIGLSWWEFRPGSSKSANWNPHLQLPSSCLQIVRTRPRLEHDSSQDTWAGQRVMY